MTHVRTLAPSPAADPPTVMHINFYNCVRDNPDGSTDKVQVSFARHFRRWRPILAGKGATTAPHAFRGLHCYSFTEDRFKNRVCNKWFRLGAFTFSRVIDVIERERPQVLHFHFRHELIDRVVGALGYRPKVVAHYHRHYTNLIVPESADVLIAVSEHIRDYIKAKSGTRTPLLVIHNPLPEDLLAHPSQPKTPRARPVLLYGGGYFAHKGFFDLTAALATLAPDTFELRLCGHHLDRYRPTQPNVIVLGFLPTDRFFEQIIEADVVLMPSHHEPFGLVALEAMHYRRLVVAAKGAGLESFCNPTNAILIEPRDSNSLADGIRRAIDICRDRPDVYADKTEQAFETSQTFSAERLAAQLENIYDRLVISSDRIEEVV